MPMPHDDERNDIQPPAPLPAPSPWKSQSWGIGRAETPDPKGGTLRALDALGQKVPMDEAAKGWSIAAPGQRPQERAVDWDPDPNKWGDESKKRYRELVEQSTLGTGYEATWDENTGWLKSLDKYSDGGGKRLKGGHGWTEWLWGKQDKHAPHVHARVRAEAERRLRRFLETGEGRPVSHRDLMAYVEGLEGRLSKEGLRARGDAIRAKGLGKEEERAALEAERAAAQKEYDEFAPFAGMLNRREKAVPGLRDAFEVLGYDNNRAAENRVVPSDRLLDEKEAEELAKKPEFDRYRGLKGLGTGALDRYIAGNGRNILPLFGALLPDADRERLTETLERVNSPQRHYPLGRTDPAFAEDREWLVQMQNRLAVQAKAAGWTYKGGGLALDSLKFAADLKAAAGAVSALGKGAASGLGALAAKGGAAGAAAARTLAAGQAAGRAWQGVKAAAEGIGAGRGAAGTALRWGAKGGIGVAEAAASGLAQTAFMPDEVMQNHQRGNEWSPTFFRDAGGELAVGASQGREGWAESFLAAAQEAFTENLGGKLFDPALGKATAGMRKAFVRGLRAMGKAPQPATKAGLIPTTRQILKDWAKTYGRDSIVGEELEEVAGRLLDVMSGRDEHSPEDSVGDRLLAVFRLDTVMGDIIGFGLSGGPLAAGGVVEAGRVHALQGQRHFEETQSKIVGKMQRAGVDPSFIAPFAEARDIGEWDRAAYELGASLDGLAQVAGALAEDATMTDGELRKVTEGMLPEYTRWQLQREDFVRRLEAAKEDAGTVRRFQNAQSEEDLRGAWDWYMNRYEKEAMPGTLKDERIADAEAKGLSLSPEGREKLAAATTRKEFEDALREAWRGNGDGEAQAAQAEPQQDAPAAAPSAEETGVAAIQGDPEAQARVDETLARVADGDVSALDDEQVMDDEDSGYDIAADFAKMEAEEAAAAAAAAGQNAGEPPAPPGEGGVALASQVPGMPTPDASALSPEARAQLEAQAQDRLGEAARQEEPTAAPGAETEKPGEEAQAAPAAEGETAAQETRQEESEEAKARREMEEVLGKGKVGVIGTDLQEGDSVTLADGTIAYVGKTDGWGKVSLYRKGWTFSNWIAGDQTIRVDKVMRGGKDATKELAERTAARESMRESAGETSGAESWKKSAEAFRRFGERLAARFPKVGDGKGGAVAPRVVVEGTEGAVIPESVRKAYEKSQRERREAAGEGKAAGFAGRGLYDPESSTIYLFEGADETTLQHETGHLIRDWARKGSPQLAAQFEKLMREMPGEVVAWARANYAGASEDLIHEEAVAEWLGRNARSVMQEILRTEADRSWWGRVKKAVARECRTVLNRLTGKPAATGGTVKIDIAALSDGDVVRRLFEELLGEEGGTYTKERLERMALRELRSLAESMKVNAEGGRQKIVRRILKAQEPKKVGPGRQIRLHSFDLEEYEMLAKLSGETPWHGAFSLEAYKHREKGDGRWDDMPEEAKPGGRFGPYLFHKGPSTGGDGVDQIAMEEFGIDDVTEFWERLGGEIRHWLDHGQGRGGSEDMQESYQGQFATERLGERLAKKYPGARQIRASELQVGDRVVFPFRSDVATVDLAEGGWVRVDCDDFPGAMIDADATIPVRAVVSQEEDESWKAAGLPAKSLLAAMEKAELAEFAKKHGVNLRTGEGAASLMLESLEMALRDRLDAARREAEAGMEEAPFQRGGNVKRNGGRPERLEGREELARDEEGGMRFSKAGAELAARLDKEPTVRVFRAMQLVDGKLYPPMAAKVGGKWVEPTELGQWYVADENPAMAGDDGYFKLDKGNGKSIKARYNPYFHTSRTPLNDQFSEAWNRPNLVTVEAEVPASELTSGYRAEKAKDAVGEVAWHKGPVSSRLANFGRDRRVILSRYCRVLRVVPDSEVAEAVAESLRGTPIRVPENTVTSSLRAELERRGVPIGAATANARRVVQQKLEDEMAVPQKENGVKSSKKTPKEILEDFIRELDGEEMDAEQRGVYEVVTGGKKTTEIRKNDLGELIKLHQGGRKKGAKKILAVHYAGKRGKVTAKEIINMGQVIRTGVLQYDGTSEHPDSHTYTLLTDDGVKLKVVVDNDKKGNEAVINFYSNRKGGNGGQESHPVSTTATNDTVSHDTQTPQADFTHSDDEKTKAALQQAEMQKRAGADYQSVGADEGEMNLSRGGIRRVTPEEDAAYMEAVERGDMEAAGRMVREAAERAGYGDGASWRMSHHAPDRETAEGGSAIRMSDAGTDEDRLMPKDVWTHPGWYFNMDDPMERESFHAISSALRAEASHRAAGDGKHAGVTMYRGVDKTKNRRESTFRNGDWVTPSRAYALREARDNAGGGRVIEMRTSLANLYWDGNSICEFGYDNGKSLAYKDTKNNRKLLDPVTRDDDGNVIPLSKRFDKNNPSMRFSKGGSAGQGMLDFGEGTLDAYAERKGIAKGRRAAMARRVEKARRFAEETRQAWERAFRPNATAEDWGAAFATPEARSGEHPTVSRVLRELYERKEGFGAEVKGLRLSHSDDVAAMMMSLRSPFQEMVKVVFVDGQMRVLDAQVVHIGSVNASMTHPVNILGGVPKGAKGFFLSHNHPSGDPSPSREDAEVTRRFREAGRLMGLEMHDHIVTDGERYYTFEGGGVRTLPAKLQSHAPWELGERMTVFGTADAERVAALARQGAKVPVVLALGNKNDIRSVRLLPWGFFEGRDPSEPEAVRAVFGHAQETVSNSVILVLPEGTVPQRRTPSFITSFTRAGQALGLRVLDVIEGEEEDGFRSFAARRPDLFQVAEAPAARDWSKAHVPEMRRELVRRGLSSLGSPSKLRERLAADDAAGQMAFSRGGVRPWPADFPKVMVHTKLGAVTAKHGEDFQKAKAGDWQAAARLVRAVVKPERIKELVARHPNAIVVPVNAEEATGNNRLPYAYACAIADAGLVLEDRIVQTVRANHTKENAIGRILRRAEFDGPVEAGREYVLVDDHVTQGGTLNELRHYIENNGGKVVEISTLTASKGSTILPIQKATMDALKAKFGPDVEHGLQQANIAGSLAALTESEGRYLLKLSPDSFRNQIVAAGLPAREGADGLPGPVQVGENGAYGGGMNLSKGGLYTGSAADYANRRPDGSIENGPSLHKIGTGEGNQAYGWGLYASEKRGVAESYAKGDVNRKNEYAEAIYKGHKYTTNDTLYYGDVVGTAIAHFLANDGRIENAVDEAKDVYEHVIVYDPDRYMAIQDGVLSKDQIRQEAFLKNVVSFLERHGKEIQYVRPRSAHANVYEQTFFNNRATPEETERHLLKWYDYVTDEQFRWVAAQLRKERDAGPVKNFLDEWEIDDEELDDDYFLVDIMETHTGKGLYNVLEDMFGSPRAASEFLARAGIDGVKYPVNSYGKTVKDGDTAGWNYVSFRDDNIRVDHKWRDGEMVFQGGGRGVPGGMEDPMAFDLNEDAVVDSNPALRALGSWFTAKPHKAGQGRWDIRDGEGRTLALNIASYQQAAWVIAQQRAEMERSMDALRKLSKEEVVEIAAARAKFVKKYARAAVAARKVAAEAKAVAEAERKAGRERVDAERMKSSEERRAAQEAEAQLAKGRREAVEALKEYMAALGIPKATWAKAIEQFQRIAGTRTNPALEAARDKATRFADTVMVKAAVGVLQKEFEESLKKAEGRVTESGVLLRATTGVRGIREAYEAKGGQEAVARRLRDIEGDIQTVERAMDSVALLEDFTRANPVMVKDLKERLGVDLDALARGGRGYNYDAFEVLDTLRRRLWAERDAWTFFGGLKHMRGREAEGARTAGDLATWIDARDRLKALSSQTLEARKEEEKARWDEARGDREQILAEMGVRVVRRLREGEEESGAPKVLNPKGKKLMRTMDDARNSRKGRAVGDLFRKFLLGHMAGGSLAEFMVQNAKGLEDGEKTGVLQGRMYEMIRRFHRCHEEELERNERSEAVFADLLRRYAGADGEGVEKRVESLARLYQPIEDPKFRKQIWTRDSRMENGGKGSMEEGEAITESLAELLPIPLLARQGEAEAGMSFREWFTRFYLDPEAVDRAAKEGYTFQDGIFKGLMAGGWAPDVVEEIQRRHEKAGVGRLGEALSRFMDSNFPELDSMVGWMYGGALKKVAHYCPARRDFVSPDIGRGGDGLGGWMRMMASFLKERTDNGLAIDSYNLIDAALAQVRRQNHLLAYYRAVDHARRVFVHRDMQIGMTQQLGEGARDVINRYLALVANGERMVNKEQKGLERVLYAVRRACGIAAVVRLSTGIKQMTSAMATVTFLPKDASVMKFWRDTARISLDLKKREEFLQEMRKNIPDFRWREKGNIDPLMEDLLAARRGKLNRVARKVAQVGGGITRWGDRWAVVSGSYGIHNAWLAHLLAGGMKREEAEKEAWLRTSAAFNETQQSNMTEFLSVFQQQNGVMSLMVQYMSSPMAISRAKLIHWHALFRGVGSKKHHTACLSALDLCQYMYFLLSGDIFSWGSGGDDDDEWWRRLLKWIGRQAVVAGEAAVGATVNGLLMGDNSVEYLASLAKGERWRLEAGDIIPAAGAIEDALNSIQQLLQGKLSTDAQIRRVANAVGAATGTPLPGATAIATGTYDAIAGDNLTWLQRVGRMLGYSRHQVGAK